MKFGDLRLVAEGVLQFFKPSRQTKMMEDKARGKALDILKQTEMSDLPDDLTMNILSRLPVKTICICKCVSKEWGRLISTECFPTLHKDHSEGSPNFLFLDQEFGDNTDYDFPQLARFSFINGESNFTFGTLAPGYIDMLPSGRSLICFAYDKSFCIFNPITRKCLLLPELQENSSIFQDDQLDAGFGFISSSNEYKLVHLFDRSTEESKYEMGCEVLTLSFTRESSVVISSSQDSWRQLEEKCPYLVHGWAVCASEVCYWMIWAGCSDSTKEGETIMSFDLKTEKFRTISHPYVPLYPEGSEHDVLILEMDGNLGLIDTYGNRGSCVAQIWMLKDPKEMVWEKTYKIPLTSLPEFYPIGYLNREVIIHTGQRSLTFYNVETKEFRSGSNMELRPHSIGCLYTDSLMLLPKSPSSGTSS